MNENEISLEGFKIVSGDYFNYPPRFLDMAMTIWEDGNIGFNKKDLEILNGCEFILLRINSDTRKVAITPTKSTDQDAIRWVGKTDPPELKKLYSRKLTETLYNAWGWDGKRVYRTKGRLVTSNNKVMILFDFSEPESWVFKGKRGS